MNIGLMARKLGMMRLFTDDGVSIPVTVLHVGANRVSQLKDNKRDGYSAIQVSYGTKKHQKINKPMAGHFAAAKIDGAEAIREFRVHDGETLGYKLGDSLSVSVFNVGEKIDVTGVSLGKGFSGSIKRHNFSSNRASHGNSVSHQSPGSISMAQDPGRVFPGKRMAGHLGSVKRTQQNLEIVRIDLERSLIYVKGSVPGSKDGLVILKQAVKAAEK